MHRRRDSTKFWSRGRLTHVIITSPLSTVKSRWSTGIGTSKSWCSGGSSGPQCARLQSSRTGGGGVQSRYAWYNTGKPVLKVLLSTHPKACAPLARILDAYPGLPPELIPVYLPEYTVIEFARRLLAGTGLGVIDSISLQFWILQFGKESGKIWHIVAEFAEWLVNEHPPWEAYCMLIYNLLIDLNKHSGVRPVEMGKNWQQSPKGQDCLSSPRSSCQIRLYSRLKY